VRKDGPRRDAEALPKRPIGNGRKKIDEKERASTSNGGRLCQLPEEARGGKDETLKKGGSELANRKKKGPVLGDKMPATGKFKGGAFSSSPARKGALFEEGEE